MDQAGSTKQSGIHMCCFRSIVVVVLTVFVAAPWLHAVPAFAQDTRTPTTPKVPTDRSAASGSGVVTKGAAGTNSKSGAPAVAFPVDRSIPVTGEAAQLHNMPCKVYYPGEILTNTAIVLVPLKPSELTISISADKPICNEAGFTSAEKASITFATLNMTDKAFLSLPKPFLTFTMRGRLVAGRFVGKTMLVFTPGKPLDQQLTKSWHKHIVDYTRPELERCTGFTALACVSSGAPGYYRDGLLFISEAQYSKPQRDAAAAAARNEEERRKPIRERRDAAFKVHDCDAVKAIDGELKEKSQHSDCLFGAAIATGDPRAMFVAASKFEAGSDRVRAKSLYSSILDRFPADDLAIKSAERLGAIGDTTQQAAKRRK
jgi:hypothetical protein